MMLNIRSEDNDVDCVHFISTLVFHRQSGRGITCHHLPSVVTEV